MGFQQAADRPYVGYICRFPSCPPRVDINTLSKEMAHKKTGEEMEREQLDQQTKGRGFPALPSLSQGISFTRCFSFDSTPVIWHIKKLHYIQLKL